MAANGLLQQPTLINGRRISRLPAIMKLQTCPSGKCRLARHAVLLALLTLAGRAFADEPRSPWLPDRVFVQTGLAEAARSNVVGANWAPVWNHGFAGGHAEVFWEASFGRWVGDRDTIHPRSQWITQVGLTPTLRWQPEDADAHWFIEAGIGANIVTPTYRRHSKRFSTAFNFGDHVGVGWRFGADGRHEVAFRLQHFSNAGIALPNPGENFRQLRYTYLL